VLEISSGESSSWRTRYTAAEAGRQSASRESSPGRRCDTMCVDSSSLAFYNNHSGLVLHSTTFGGMITSTIRSRMVNALEILLGTRLGFRLQAVTENASYTCHGEQLFVPFWPRSAISGLQSFSARLSLHPQTACIHEGQSHSQTRGRKEHNKEHTGLALQKVHVHHNRLH